MFRQKAFKSLKGNEKSELPILEMRFIRNIRYSHILEKYFFSLITTIILSYEIFLLTKLILNQHYILDSEFI